ncbi:aromatic ring-hydroxylating dioxygenase subunit alpha [Nostoc sp. CHAB 5784]|uniref:aromatic ring-hydroxylating dioxygenase subunit alpha n=1 Tax=Nostoc mirabile TaxID=2907820 RepID=UPI001E43C7BC|nr:aromatic ring-hydroxylating dioxygenase subunit alpha [Nostoc mirabile]MCC5669181.1 aromatic ring-hydroxylating dioxygenase subunit alpha [Nostoc mirabile CHAB5784]
MTSIIETIKQPKPTKSEASVNKNPMNLTASWYIAMLSKELGKKPKAIQLFGQDLVAWRDTNGTPVIMERYCSHMGASLAIGELKDGCIQCPFHHWQYDNEGNCVSIPDIENIPPTARQATYVTQERYGYIWVWYGTSSPLFPLPEFPAAEGKSHNYMRFLFALKAKTTARRMLENAYDYPHLGPLHKWNINSMQITLLDDFSPESQLEPPTKSEVWLRIAVDMRLKKYFGITGLLAGVLGLNSETFRLTLDTWPSGHLLTIFVEGKERFQALVAINPIDENNTIEYTLNMIDKTGLFWHDLVSYVVFGWQNYFTSSEDIPLWNTMKPNGGGAYTKLDHTVLKYREFYQKWVNKVEV